MKYYRIKAFATAMEAFGCTSNLPIDKWEVYKI